MMAGEAMETITLQAEFEALFSPLLQMAYGTAVRLTRNRTDAEDLVQDAALLAYKAFGTFQRGTNFKAWFFRILTECVLQPASEGEAREGQPQHRRCAGALSVSEDHRGRYQRVRPGPGRRHHGPARCRPGR